MLSATKNQQWVRALQSKLKAFRHIKFDSVLKIGANLHSRLNLCVYCSLKSLKLNFAKAYAH